MIRLIFLLILFSYSSLGYDFGQYYSRIRIYEYEEYSDVQLFKFDITSPTTLANWSIVIDTNGKCSDYRANIHFDLQHGAYPLIAPNNETFPETYITTRHDLTVNTFNQTISHRTVQLRDPLIGTWFAAAFVERLSKASQSKKSASNCNIHLTAWLDYQVVPVFLTLTVNQPLPIVLSNNLSSVYASFYTSIGTSRITVLSEWSSTCDVLLVARLNGLPSSTQNDYQTVCGNGTCSIEIGQLAGLVWIYFRVSVKNIACLTDPILGSLSVLSSECQVNSTCIQSYPTRRLIFNSYYDYLYIPTYTNFSNYSLEFHANHSSVYAYEFLVDDRNTGGTIHLDFRPQMKVEPVNSLYQLDNPNSLLPLSVNVSILACLSKHQPRRYDACETDYRILLNINTLTVKSLPYPEMALWYLTLEQNCNDSRISCDNLAVSMTMKISSSACTQDQCGEYGFCRIFTSQQAIFSSCSCLAGYRGYACTDGSQANLSKYLPSVLFLTLSNLMFIPAIALALYYRLYIEALVYFFNMFFSTFYHACDQEIHQFCLFKYDGLQLADFIGSYSSFVITLITMALVPRAIKAFLFVLGVLTCVVINSRNRFDSLQFIAVTVMTFAFTVLTWVVVSIRNRRLQPSCRHLLYIIPGIVFATVGLVLFTVAETDDNYWYIHSIWHMLIALSILFFLPRRISQTKQRQSSSETNRDTTSPLGASNEGAMISPDEIENARDTS